MVNMHTDLHLNYLSDCRNFHTLNQVYECVNELALRSICNQVGTIHDKNTRPPTSKMLNLPVVRLTQKERLASFNYVITTSDFVEVVYITSVANLCIY